MKRIAIVGLGLMGGSIGLAVRRKRLALEIRGYARREETRRRALTIKAVDRCFDSPAVAVDGADLVIFCVPVLSIADLVGQAMPGLAPGCMVSDVGSTKGDLSQEIRRLLKGMPVRFIGSHPMTGSEETGIAAARADLYEGATVIVTPVDRRERHSTAALRLQAFWRGLGSQVVVLPPREHDRLIARVSHLPHLVAAALVANLNRDGGQAVRRVVGPGFLDTTRIAAGSESMWHDIIKSNRRDVSLELAAFSKQIDALRRMIDKKDFDGVRAFLARSRDQRSGMKELRA